MVKRIHRKLVETAVWAEALGLSNREKGWIVSNQAEIVLLVQILCLQVDFEVDPESQRNQDLEESRQALFALEVQLRIWEVLDC